MSDEFMDNETFIPQIIGIKNKDTERLLNFFFVLEVSGSMLAERRIDAVNEAFSQMIPALRQIQMDNLSEFEMRIAIMTFDETARWIVPPSPIMEYNYEDIKCNGGVTYFSKAFKELNEKLSRKEFMAFSGKIAEPYIIFMIDGEPTEEDNYQPELDSLLENGWFKASRRFAVLIGKDTINSPVSRASVRRFVNSEADEIIELEDFTTLLPNNVLLNFSHYGTKNNYNRHIYDNDAFIGGIEDYNAGGFVGFGGFDDESFI